jgi:hypothetical protein
VELKAGRVSKSFIAKCGSKSLPAWFHLRLPERHIVLFFYERPVADFPIPVFFAP